MLSVPEANAVVDPGTVVVHNKHASIAGGTMVASLWFEHIAHQTISTSLRFTVTLVEPRINILRSK